MLACADNIQKEKKNNKGENLRASMLSKGNESTKSCERGG